jgi:hypothetical protein
MGNERSVAPAGGAESPSSLQFSSQVAWHTAYDHPCEFEWVIRNGGRTGLELFYDQRDARYHEARGSEILYWLDDLGAKPLSEARPGDHGFLFTGARPIADYSKLVAALPNVRDRADERVPLLELDSVLAALEAGFIRVPTPKTWLLPLGAPLPPDLTFPLFVRTAISSWMLGGGFRVFATRPNWK